METNLNLTTGGEPFLTSEVIVRVPAGWDEVGELEETDYDNQDAYRTRLRALLNRLGLFDEGQIDDLLRTDPLPRRELDRHVTELTFVSADRLGYFEFFAGPWHIEPIGADFNVSIEVGTQKSAVLWRPKLRVDEGVEIDNWSRGAETGGPRLVAWEFAPGSSVRAVSARVDPESFIEARLASGSWVNYARGASGYVAFVLVALFVLVFSQRRDAVLPGEDRYLSARTWARRIAAATVAVIVAQFVVFTLGFWGRSLIEDHTSDEHWYYATVVDYLEVVVAIVAIAWILPRLALVQSGRGRIANTLLVIALLVVALPLALASWPAEDIPDLVPRSNLAKDILALALVVVFGAYVVLLSLQAAARLWSESGGAEVRRRLARLRVFDSSLLRRLRSGLLGRDQPGRSGWSRQRTVLALAIATAVVAWWLGQQYNDYRRITAEVEGAAFADFLRFFPLEMLFALDGLLSLLLLFALLAVLQAAGSTADGVAFGVQRLRIWWIPALVFAGWGIGVSGTLRGFAFPLPAVLTFLVILWFTRPHLERRQEAIVGANAEETSPNLVSDEFREEMLHRAREIAAVRRRKKALYDEYRGGTLPEREYDAKFKDAQREEEVLRKGGIRPVAEEPIEPKPLTFPERVQRRFAGEQQEPDPPAAKPLLALPPGCSPYSFALSLGPYSSWWANARFAAAVATLLGLVPLVYFGLDYSTYSSGLMPVYTLFDFVGELARWVVAGVVFGCCYAYLPGRVGVIKAGALLVVVGLAIAFLLIIPDTDFPSRLPSEVFLLALTLIVVGVVMDWKSLRNRQIDLRHLGDLYELHLVKKGAALTPVALAVLGVFHRIATGDWGGAKSLITDITDLIKSI